MIGIPSAAARSLASAALTDAGNGRGDMSAPYTSAPAAKKLPLPGLPEVKDMTARAPKATNPRAAHHQLRLTALPSASSAWCHDRTSDPASAPRSGRPDAGAA